MAKSKQGSTMSLWQTKSSDIVYENFWMTVREDQIVMPDGKNGMYGYVSSKSDAVFVIPIDDAGNTYVIQQEHYPGRQTIWQFIGGRSDNQPPDIAAKRELLEETGLEAQSITILGRIKSAVGLSTFGGTYCLARNVTTASSKTDKSEGILAIKKLPLREVKEMIISGEIANAESIALYFLATSYLEQEKAI